MIFDFNLEFDEVDGDVLGDGEVEVDKGDDQVILLDEFYCYKDVLLSNVFGGGCGFF